MPAAITCRSVGHLRPDPNWRIPAHAHPHHELIVVLHGRMRVTAGGRERMAAAGDVLLYPAGVAHAEQADPADPVESLFCSFHAPAFGQGEVAATHDHDGRLRQMARWLHADQTATAATASQVARHCLFRALLAEFQRGDRSPEPRLRLQLRRYVRLHLAAPFAVAALARDAGLSRWHYIRTYRRQTGRTPMADVRHERLDCAHDWLLTTTLPLKEVARRAGLGTAQAFSRVFSARYGQPPAAFRRAQQGG